MGTKVELSRFSITRIITITPFYMVFNRTRDCVSFAEMGDSGLGKVHGVESRKLVPFWPCSHSGRMTCAVNDTSMVHSSMPFKYTETQSLLLRIHSEDGFGELTISKHSQSGSHGGAKTTPDHLSPTIQEEEEGRDETDDKDDDSVFERDIVPSVGPDSSAAAVKEDPRHSPRIAKSFKTVHQFVRSTKRITSSLIKRVTKTSISQSFYWVSFQDGLQRVVLFTADKQVQDHVLSDNGTERAHLRITLSLYGLGLSLVNDELGTEVAYIAMPPSDAMWESERKGGRWRRVQGQLNDKLEVAHEAYLGSSSSSSTEPCAQLPDSEYKVDFAHSYLIDKSDDKVSIRRRYFEGLWTRLSLSKHLTTVQARINEIQVDNVLPFALHPTILYAYPQPPTIVAKYGADINHSLHGNF